MALLPISLKRQKQPEEILKSSYHICTTTCTCIFLPPSSFVHASNKIKFYFHGLEPISSCLHKDINQYFSFLPCFLSLLDLSYQLIKMLLFLPSLGLRWKQTSFDSTASYLPFPLYRNSSEALSISPVSDSFPPIPSPTQHYESFQTHSKVKRILQWTRI